MGCTLLLLLVILLHDFSTTVTAFDKSGDFATRQSLPYRRCKFYSVKVVSGGAAAPARTGAAALPNEDFASGKKTNVGAVVGFTFLLVFVIAIVVVCIYRNRRSPSSPRIATQQPVVVQPAQAQELVQRPARPEKKGVAGEVEPKEGVRAKKVVGKDDDVDKVARQKRPNNLGQGQGKGGGDDKKKKEVAGEVIEPKGDGRDVKGREEVVGKANDDDVKVARPNVGQGQRNEERGDVKKKEVAGEVNEPKEDEVRHQGKKDGEKGKKPQEVDKENGNSIGSPKKYTYKYLKSVTDNFAVKNKIGGGGFGIVYRGEFMDGTVVAVKVLKYEGKIDDFKNEVEALGTADHPNLVKLIGYCDEALMRILVYEYMSNGSLDKWIFKSEDNKSLTWPEMKNIILGIARGLEYLHEKRGDKKILHRDLKPPNVVLDSDKNAKLCDFGIAKLMDKDQTSTSTAWAGTEWYMAPEAKISRISDKVDVYSFGVVVLEVIFGKQYQYLVSSDRANNTKQVKLQVLIKNLGENMRKNGMEIKEFGNLAINCIKEKPEERPTMSKVVVAIRDLEAGFKEAKAGRN